MGRRFTHKAPGTACLAFVVLIGPAILLIAGSATSAAQSGPKPRGYKRVVVFAIGIDSYLSPALGDLKSPEAETRELTALLKESYGYEIDDPLLGARATKKAIEERLTRYGRELDEEDSLIIYFGGHGKVLDLPSYGRAGFLIPQEAQLDPGLTIDPGLWRERALDMTALVARLENLKAKHVLLIADSCCSGFMTRLRGSELKVDLAALLGQPSRFVLSATTADQKASSDRGTKRAFFTGSLIKHLKTPEAQSLTDLFVRVREEVFPASNGTMQPQMRNVSEGDGEFVFIPLAIEEAEVKAALEQVGRQVLRRRSLGSTLHDIVISSEALDYRFSSEPEPQRKIWEQRFKRFQENAPNGDVRAMAALTLCYGRGLGVDPDPKRAYEWALQADDRGGIGEFLLGMCYLNGWGVAANRLAARELFKASENRGFPLGQVELGLLLLDSSRDQRQTKEAVALLQQGADLGIAKAQLALSDAYTSGRVPGLPQDFKAAIALYEKAAKPSDADQKPIPLSAVHPKALWALYQIYSQDIPGGPPKNLKRAESYLVASANAGYAPAQLNYASELMQLKGMVRSLSLRQDLSRGEDYLDLAARQGDPYALGLAAELYSVGGEGLAKNIKKARSYLDNALSKELPAAYTIEGMWHLYGRDGLPDQGKALRAFRKAATTKGGDGQGCFLYATVLDAENRAINPATPDQTRAEILYYFAKSADLGYRGDGDVLSPKYQLADKLVLLRFDGLLVGTFRQLQANYPDGFDLLIKHGPEITADLIAAYKQKYDRKP